MTVKTQPLLERRHRCHACRLRWVVFGRRYPDPRCPFCGNAGLTASIVQEPKT